MKKFFSTTKYRLLLLLIITGSTTAIAQKGEPYELNIKGVKVIVQPSDNQIVEIQTIVKGGVQNYGFDKQGIESLAMNALTECGTKKDDKNSFKNKLDNVSAQVYANAGRDYSTISMNCIKSDFNAVWTLYADAVTMPLFDEKEFNRIKQDAINGLRSQESQPDYAINNMATQIAFAGKNKAKRPEGTVETLSKLTVAETKAYYSSVSTKSRMLIVVVDKDDKADQKQQNRAMLAAVPEANPFV